MDISFNESKSSSNKQIAVAAIFLIIALTITEADVIVTNFAEVASTFTNVLVIFATAVIVFVIVTDQHRGFVAVAGLPIAIAAAAGVPLAIAVLFLIGSVASKSLICGAIVAFGPRLVFIYLNSL